MKNSRKGFLITMIVALLAVTTVFSGCTFASYVIPNDKKYKSYSIKVCQTVYDDFMKDVSGYQPKDDEYTKSEFEYQTDTGVAAICENVVAGTYRVKVEGITDDGTYESCASGKWEFGPDNEFKLALVINYDSDKSEINFSTVPAVNDCSVAITNTKSGETVGTAKCERDKSNLYNINAVVENVDAGNYTYYVCFGDDKASGTINKTNGKDYNLNVVYNQDTQKATLTEVKA